MIVYIFHPFTKNYTPRLRSMNSVRTEVKELVVIGQDEDLSDFTF